MTRYTVREAAPIITSKTLINFITYNNIQMATKMY
jgi:hypothetical protein